LKKKRRKTASDFIHFSLGPEMFRASKPQSYTRKSKAARNALWERGKLLTGFAIERKKKNNFTRQESESALTTTITAAG
jgi:hypothetical protein